MFNSVKFAVLSAVGLFMLLTPAEKTTLTGLMRTKYGITNTPLDGANTVTVTAYAADGTVIYTGSHALDALTVRALIGAQETALGKVTETVVISSQNPDVHIYVPGAAILDDVSVAMSVEVWNTSISVSAFDLQLYTLGSYNVT